MFFRFSASIKRFNELKMSLDRVESFTVALEQVLSSSVLGQTISCLWSQRVAPQKTRPRPILPNLPAPEAPSSPPQAAPVEVSIIEEGSGEEMVKPLRTDDLLPSDTPFAQPTEGTFSPTVTLVPPTAPSSATKSTVTAHAPTPKFLHNSNALQEELSEQLAQMATQLKRNAVYFSESLGKDKAVVEAAQEKIESNFDIMKLERLRLRDLRGKTGSTTCIVLMSVIVVSVSVVMMFFVIRLT